MSIPILPPPPDIPQVLLFGHSGAGKSAILGALLKAAETQGPTLRGEVLESSGRLATIRDAVYQGTALEPAATELTSYTVRLRPWREGTKTVIDPITVVLNDCSGKAAESLISHPEAIRDVGTRAPVARAVIDADAIVLMVDGSSDDDELREAFEEFDTFLTIVAQAKENAREVGGFPVLLVLTQCDKLARPDDTYSAWEQRVEQRAERAWAKFDAYLKDADPDDDVPSPFLPFGSIDLTVYAVAVKLPKLGGIPAQPNTPFRVAELFRDCFVVAKSHRDRVAASDRRLRWTVRLALSFVSMLMLGVLTVAILQPTPEGPNLAERVRGYQEHEPAAETRLAYPYLTRNKHTLNGFRDDRAYGNLPEDLRSFVDSRLKEIDDYEAFRGKLLGALAPGDTRSLDDLARVERTLREGELALPAEYAWGKTHAAELRQKWLADVRAIQSAEATFLEKYRDYIRRGTVLTLRPSLGENWRSEVAALVAEASKPPAPLDDPLPGSPALTQPRGQALTNRVPFEFERVYNARKDWDVVRDRLQHLRDLGDALGLTAGAERPEAPLVLPEPGTGGVDSAALPGARWTALLRNFTRESDDFREWETRNFPDPVRTLLNDRLDRSFRVGTRHVHALLRARMGPDVEAKDTPEWWRSTADALGDPGTPFPEWGRLLHLLARLRDPAAPNPVAELAAFLRQEKLDLNLAGFDVYLPPDLGLGKVVPSGSFTITITPPGGTPTSRSFKQAGPGQRDGSGMSYRFMPETDGKLTYRPGDEFKAELPVRIGTQDAKLVWETATSRAYQFDKLTHEPRLVKATGGSEPGAGVRVTLGPTFPRLPVLFPELRK